MVFTCESPSLVLTYDSVIGLHSLWKVTRARPEVLYSADVVQYVCSAVPIKLGLFMSILCSFMLLIMTLKYQFIFLLSINSGKCQNTQNQQEF